MFIPLYMCCSVECERRRKRSRESRTDRYRKPHAHFIFHHRYYDSIEYLKCTFVNVFVLKLRNDFSLVRRIVVFSSELLLRSKETSRCIPPPPVDAPDAGLSQRTAIRCADPCFPRAATENQRAFFPVRAPFCGESQRNGDPSRRPALPTYAKSKPPLRPSWLRN